MTIDDLATRIAADILERKEALRKRMLIVALEGKGCSGKTTLSRSLKTRLVKRGVPAEAVSIDDFCKPRSARYDEAVPLGLQVYVNNFDREHFLNDVVRRASIHQSLEFDGYTLDVATDEYTNHVTIALPEGGVLLIEGLHILKDEFLEYVDFAIFLHISDEEQLRRALVRDAVERAECHDDILYKYKNRFVPSYNHFVENDHPLEKADIIVNLESIDAPLVVTREELLQDATCNKRGG